MNNRGHRRHDPDDERSGSQRSARGIDLAECTYRHESTAALNAPAGTVVITATLGNLTLGDATLQQGGTISAPGYNVPGMEPVAPGYPVSYTALSGGSVSLSAPAGP